MTDTSWRLLGWLWVGLALVIYLWQFVPLLPQILGALLSS